MITRNNDAPAVQRASNRNASKSEIPQRGFAFLLERVILPAVRLFTPSHQLPLDWQNFGEHHDSFNARKKASSHRCASAKGHLCELCLEHLAGFRPIFDTRLILKELCHRALRGCSAFCLAIWQCISGFAVFCVSIWFVVPTGLSPKERQREEERKRREKEEEERERRRQEEDEDCKDEQNNSMLNNLNELRGPASYADKGKLKEDLRLTAEANHIAGTKFTSAAERDQAMREWNKIARETEQMREIEAAKRKKRSQIRSELDKDDQILRGIESEIARQVWLRNWDKVRKLRYELHHVAGRMEALIREFERLK